MWISAFSLQELMFSYDVKRNKFCTDKESLQNFNNYHRLLQTCITVAFLVASYVCSFIITVGICIHAVLAHPLLPIEKHSVGIKCGYHNKKYLKLNWFDWIFCFT